MILMLSLKMVVKPERGIISKHLMKKVYLFAYIVMWMEDV
jgi:hypothetical protein